MQRQLLARQSVVRPAEASPGPFSFDRAVLQVCDRWGASVLWNPAYPTPDRGIPWGWFWYLWRRVEMSLALERVQLTTAVAVGYAMTQGSDEAKDWARRDIGVAYE